MSDPLTGKRILIIEDDPNLSQTIEMVFSLQQCDVVIANDGQQGLHEFTSQPPDLVVLDILMPDMDGWDVLQQIREVGMTPVIMLTTLDTDEQIVRGLDLGADDFISKPFTATVLLARARAVLRRATQWTPQPTNSYQDDYLMIDLTSRQVLVQGKPIRLTATEFDLLTYLLQNAGRVLTYQQILDNVWGWEYRDNTDYVHVYLSHLRRKLEEDPKQPQYLLTVHGVGYRFRRFPTS